MDYRKQIKWQMAWSVKGFVIEQLKKQRTTKMSVFFFSHTQTKINDVPVTGSVMYDV